MPSQPRFTSPADNTRPYGSRRYNVYGPKAGRLLTFFGRHTLQAWISLEADPNVTAYCERPIVISHAKPKRIVDFWIARSEEEELWFLLRENELGNDVSSCKSPAFQHWATTNGFKVKLTDPVDLERNTVYLENWGAILRYLSINPNLISGELIDQVRAMARAPRPLAAIQASLPEYDPIIVRTAIFSLLHKGKMKCDDIETRPLSIHSTFEAI
jgi:hypothetical protein